VLLVGFMRRHHPGPSHAIDRAAAAAITTHTIPIQPMAGSREPAMTRVEAA
jgi:hypothetical protein